MICYEFITLQNYGLVFAMILPPHLSDTEKGDVLGLYEDDSTGMPLEDRVDQALRSIRDVLVNPSM